MAGIAFGLFDWIDHRQVPLEQLYEERLEVLTAADAAGFSCYHLAEHHTTPLGMAPSPGLFLAAAAQRTRQLNPHVTTPRLGITRQVIVAEGDAEAEAIARAVHPRWAASFLKLWSDHGDTTYQHLCGSPSRVREQLTRLIAQTEVNYVVCCFAWGDLTLAQSLRSLRLFATEVMPGFAGSAS